MTTAKATLQSIARLLVLPLVTLLRPRVLPSSAPIAAFILGVVLVHDQDYGRSFFGASAQVIPVLLLALAVEARVFRLNLVSTKELAEAIDTRWLKQRKPRRGPWLFASVDEMAAMYRDPVGQYLLYRIQMVVVLAILVTGEAFSFLAFGHKPPEPEIYQAVAMGAIFAGLASVVVTALVGPIRPSFGVDSEASAGPDAPTIASCSPRSQSSE